MAAVGRGSDTPIANGPQTGGRPRDLRRRRQDLDEAGISRAGSAVTVEHVADSGIDLDSQLDLKTQLNRAYLSGNGAEVERVMALIAAAQNAVAQEIPSPTVGRRKARAA